MDDQKTQMTIALLREQVLRDAMTLRLPFEVSPGRAFYQQRIHDYQESIAELEQMEQVGQTESDLVD